MNKSEKAMVAKELERMLSGVRTVAEEQEMTSESKESLTVLLDGCLNDRQRDFARAIHHASYELDNLLEKRDNLNEYGFVLLSFIDKGDKINYYSRFNISHDNLVMVIKKLAKEYHELALIIFNTLKPYCHQ